MSLENTIFLALGANLGDMSGSFFAAIEQIDRTIGPVRCVSSFYATKALNPPGLSSQPDYLNAALECRSRLAATEVMHRILEIEKQLGRDRSKELRWGPRVIDIDILLYGDQVIDSNGLCIPHAEMHRREFVLRPLAEIAPQAMHPSLKKSVIVLFEELAVH